MMNEMMRDRVADNFVDAVKTEAQRYGVIVTHVRNCINFGFYGYEGSVDDMHRISYTPVEIDDNNLDRLASDKIYFKFAVASIVDKIVNPESKHKLTIADMIALLLSC